MSQEEAFEKLEQLICDENRIVTYKILSKELDIHVNKSKQYLFDYFQHRSGEELFDAYFYIAGFQKDSDGLKTFKFFVVSNDNLEKVKKDFNSITSCHIFSLNRGKLQDECALYTADQEGLNNLKNRLRFSSIKHSGVTINERVFIKAKPAVKTNGASIEKLPNKEEQPQLQKTNGSSEKTSEKVSPKLETNDKKISPQTKNLKGNSLMSMWQKKEEKSQKEDKSKKEEKSQKDVPKKPTKEQKSTKGSSNSLMKMFSKQSEKQTANANHSSGKKEVVLQTKSEISETSTKKEIVEKAKSIEKKTSKSTAQKRKSIQREQIKKMKAISDSDSGEDYQPKKKKHKRIVTFDDSDSESECEEERDRAQRELVDPESPLGTSAPMDVEEDDDEELIPPTPPVQTKRKIPQISMKMPATPVPKGKSRSWKTVSKTYEDEDGFLVTKKEKELVLVSDESDGEDPIHPKHKKPALEEDQNQTKTVNRKQASLTSFFKQKC